MRQRGTRLEALVSAVESDCSALPERMGLESDAVVIDQCGRYEYEERSLASAYHKESGISALCRETDDRAEASLSGAGHEPGTAGHSTDSGECLTHSEYRVRIWHCAERGVGLSRNLALFRSGAGLIQFADEDIVYDRGYADRIIGEFDAHPEADILLFNVQATKGRETYHIDSYGRVRRWSCGRYPAYAICARRETLIASGVTFSLLFGGGARYSNGEDSIFLMDCIKAGLRIYHTPVSLGYETERESGSTWFNGFSDSFYHDRGVLYRRLYGRLAPIMALRWLLVGKNVRDGSRSVWDCYRVMREGFKGDL